MQAFRKPGMDVVVAAYNQTFSKFNNDVRTLCFKDDPWCQGDVSDKESQVWQRIKGTTW